ncbi:MAG: helix-turn-helix domain-containing protein [Verrucomicrobia bacterium]|nr:helix-turn-helix domain-containing protein [Verrucomicrobiota bacterium]
MRAFLNLSRALADQARVRALLALERRALCVCQITALLGLAPSTVSKHLSILHQAGLVETRKTGRWIYYSRPRAAAPMARQALAWARRSLTDHPRVAEDARRLQQILRCEPAKLCQRQDRS